MEVLSQGLVLHMVPAHADAQAQAAPAQHVYLGSLFRHQDGLALGQNQDPGCQADLLGDGGHVAHQGEWLMDQALVAVVTKRGMVVKTGVCSQDVVRDKYVGVVQILGGLSEIANRRRVGLDLRLRENDSDLHSDAPS